MGKVFVLTLLLFNARAFAYADKTYECRNVDNLPNNVYKITTVDLGAGVRAPFIEITRYIRNQTGNSASPMTKAEMRGIATVSVTTPGIEAFLIGALRLEFDGDKLLNCRQ